MKFTKLGLILGLLVVAFYSCSDDNDNGYAGLNETYITAEGTKALTYGEEGQKISAKLTLSKKVKEATVLKLKVVDGSGVKVDVVQIVPESITIEAGARESAFEIVLNKGGAVLSERRLTVSIESQGLIKAREDLPIVVKPAIFIRELTEKQRVLLEAYEAKGMNIAPFLGKVKVKTTIHSAKDSNLKDFATAFTKEVEGISVLTLSDKATETQPVLKMTENPMGMTEFFYYLLRKETVENDEFWYGEYAGPSYKKVMDLINWNRKSKETFSVALDGINVGEVKKGVSNLEYIGKQKNSLGDDINVVPFAFSYTAWDRLQEKVKEGNSVAKSSLESDGTSNPSYYLNKENISNDEFGGGAFKETTGSIDFTKGKIVFEFLTSHATGADYLQVKAEYSIE